MKKSYIWMLLQVLIAIASGVLLLVVAEHTVGKNIAKRAVARITMPFLALSYTSKSSAQATTVIIDQRSLDESGETWPPTYEYHARNLLAIGSYHPKAVFVDIIFTDDRKDRSIHQLVDAACRLKKQGTHVVFAADTSTGQPSIRPELMNSGCIELASAESDQDIYDMQSWNYPLNTYAGKSAALTLYEQINPKSEIGLHTDHPQSMSLIWPFPTQEDLSRITSNQCKDSKKWNLISTIKLSLFADADKPCLPFASFFGWELRNTNVELESQLEKNMRGKVVFVGTNLIGIPDKISSPINGLIPGIFLHAVAYDNLSTFESNWKRSNGLLEHGGNWGIFWTMLMIGMTVTLLVVVHEIVLIRDYFIISGRHLERLVLLITGLLLAALMMWVSHSILNIGLLVYAEVMAATAAAHFLHISENVKEFIRKVVFNEAED